MGKQRNNFQFICISMNFGSVPISFMVCVNLFHSKLSNIIQPPSRAIPEATNSLYLLFLIGYEAGWSEERNEKTHVVPAFLADLFIYCTSFMSSLPSAILLHNFSIPSL